jgi:hypothetical protein
MAKQVSPDEAKALAADEAGHGAEVRRRWPRHWEPMKLAMAYRPDLAKALQQRRRPWR